MIALAFTLGCRSNDVLDTSGVGSQPITITVVPATVTAALIANPVMKGAAQVQVTP